MRQINGVSRNNITGIEQTQQNFYTSTSNSQPLQNLGKLKCYTWHSKKKFLGDHTNHKQSSIILNIILLTYIKKFSRTEIIVT